MPHEAFEDGAILYGFWYHIETHWAQEPDPVLK